jgi:hypothetical protein
MNLIEIGPIVLRFQVLTAAGMKMTDVWNIVWLKYTIVHAMQPRDPTSRINFCKWFLIEGFDCDLLGCDSMQSSGGYLYFEGTYRLHFHHREKLISRTDCVCLRIECRGEYLVVRGV